jgi:hypothetical protein
MDMKSGTAVRGLRGRGASLRIPVRIQLAMLGIVRSTSINDTCDGEVAVMKFFTLSCAFFSPNFLNPPLKSQVGQPLRVHHPPIFTSSALRSIAITLSTRPSCKLAQMA